MEMKELSKEDQALFDAIKDKNVDKVKEALKNANVNAQSTWDGTPLNYAASLGNPEMVKLLCDNGAYIEGKDPTGQTPLMNAALEGHEEAADVLMDKGAKITNDLAMSMDKKVSILEENAERGMIKPEALAKWKAFLKKLQEYSKK